MLTPPALPNDAIAARLASTWDLQGTRAEFLPLGADVDSAAFRIDAPDGRAYFLKLRRGGFGPAVVDVPAVLHHMHGIDAVMAPLLTLTRRLSMQDHGFDWALYPFFDGADGFTRAPTDRQWTVLGTALSAIHRAELPASMLAGLPRESYSHHWREGVRRYQRRFINGVAGDDLVTHFLAFWDAHDEEIDSLIYRSEQLASILLEKSLPQVLCHSDLHAGNVLLGDGDRLCIVDWDTLILAPKERDLMFIGAGVGGVWNQPREAALFFEGYGATQAVDALALAYYRHERIVKDLLEFCDQMFDSQASREDREEGLRQMTSQFEPGNVIAVAHRDYDAIT
ncbi:phosphotransferase enzyme family protein [Acidovorax cavernicola]|uniref:Aminoglycoside phosphotransferase family protein n=1 Tax=Acidovorax cavernicola TaxID=1675792 RepID=A0A9X8GTW5_9BURK|nr:aminoglycoside phosphotransferase family protein [Acidovorax cavernicola]RIX76789.1 aminoglycoside phosphotransferase family protein [Acidovorax cavernicola]